ncbi:hypothetical protein [Microbaculum marinisediminis]|uniref:Uncharacterized protein n=1 Tax=Microbaculum marinisediminis TaxID=2931392 RepID=A0AAW5QUG9_9HYPH|nr:hypothetical protein [Microbaculum sp. A6E488]MCT8970544.1 hypothetical protein [Microbaculum sp. A6E488]
MFNDTEPVRTTARTTSSRQIIRHHIAAAQARWERLTTADYARIATTADLITTVGSRYNLPPDQAKRDVDLWLKDIES